MPAAKSYRDETRHSQRRFLPRGHLRSCQASGRVVHCIAITSTGCVARCVQNCRFLLLVILDVWTMPLSGVGVNLARTMAW